MRDLDLLKVLLSDQVVAADPGEILREVAPEEVPAAAPPEAANYREADLDGLCCANCVKFSYRGFIEDEGGMIPTGVCTLWEAEVRGDFVSDSFADDSPALDEEGKNVWDFAEDRVINEVHLSGSDQSEEEGFVIKEILRTGEWPVIPTASGKVNKPLRIVRDGLSNPSEGTISLAEVVENFKAGAMERVQIPLSDEENDHKNITRVNTGFIRDIWIVDEENGAKLVAKMDFTEPEVKDKVLRGTYADVSCGIPWAVTRQGKRFGATLEHVAITNRPFIDGLGPFLAASDKEDVEVEHFGNSAEQETPGNGNVETPTETNLSAQEIMAAASSALISQLRLSSDYRVVDVAGTNVVIEHSYADQRWTVPFTATESDVQLAQVGEWRTEEKSAAPAEQKPAAPRGPSSVEDELEAARKIREIRLSDQSDPHRKEENMPLTREELDQLNLSDEQRAAFQRVLDEQAQLSATVREREADTRVAELSDGLGLKERPGFLKFYRQIFLSDDGGAAAVLLSDDGKEKERVTALQILDRALDALKGSDGKVALSDQALASGNDEPPPADASGEKPVEERLAEAREALFGQK